MLDPGTKIVRDLFGAIDAQDLGKLAGLLSSDFSLSAPGLDKTLSAGELFEVIKAHYRAFPDWIHSIEDILIDGDKVAVKLIQSGTQEAEYEGIPATHNTVSMQAMHLITIREGKVREWWAVEDYLGLYNQLGMELKPKQS
jgi:predicted ester cyclase